LRGQLSTNDSVRKLYDLISSWLPKAFQSKSKEEKHMEFISRQISAQVSDAQDLVEASEWIRKVCLFIFIKFMFIFILKNTVDFFVNSWTN